MPNTNVALQLAQSWMQSMVYMHSACLKMCSAARQNVV